MTRAALLAALAALACACRERAPTAGLEPRQALEGFSMSQSRRGTKSWDLSAKTAFLRDDARQASLVEPTLTFHRGGKTASRVTALRGEALLDASDVVLSSSVVVTSLEDGAVLKTESLTYSSAKRKFFTEAPVLIQRPGATVRGEGFEANPDLSEIRIFRQSSTFEGKRRS